MRVFTLDFEKPIVELEQTLESLRKQAQEQQIDLSAQIRTIEEKLTATRKEIYSNLTPWQRVQLARHPRRPYTLDYLQRISSEFIELHGDRRFGDDQAIVGGLATIGDHRVMIVGHQKGRDTKENLRRNFGCPHPEGYRKALRLMQLAEKYSLPVISFIDTPGAYPGIGAEERHIAESIAVNLREMMLLKTPTVAIVIGEGGSGGALGIGVCDRILILENAYYSVISPEGCAAILWKDRAAAPQAAAALKLTATDLLQLGVVDEILPEPLGGAHLDYDTTAATVKAAILKELKQLSTIPIPDLLAARYQRYRKVGVVTYAPAPKTTKRKPKSAPPPPAPANNSNPNPAPTPASF
ncbi:MAG: acetyl-CoA carboxylase carboxyltransferase subunit alpha [Verrucomicrobiae bacterium]|nr:acetyl-CoA carboxylase carboxyltransferase subunit alpha [Verrucomicrobiae bacterium]